MDDATAIARAQLPAPTDGTASSTTSNAGSRASTPATPAAGPAASAPADKKDIERRILPARLRRVSSLLAGSAIDDDFLNAIDKGDAPLLPPTTRIIISSYAGWPASFTAPDADDVANGVSFFSSAELARACRAREIIETPEFRTRDDSEVLGKTRGSRVEEDTSDAAYERRHQRPDKMEKKQRRLEKERLVKEKHKLEDRIEQVRTADARLLMPILVAREQRGGVATSMRGVEATFGLGRSNMSSEASANLQRLEALRQDLLEEANETLRRYEALLPEEVAAVPANDKRKRAGEDESGAEESDSPSVAAGPSQGRRITLVRNAAQRRASAAAKEVTRRTTALPRSRLSDSAVSTREARAGRRSDRHAAPASAPSTPRARSDSKKKKRATAASPVLPQGTSIHAEAKHINIHARTSGGRFAPKAALSTGKAKEALQPRARRADGTLLSKAATQRILQAQRERERTAGGSEGASASASVSVSPAAPKAPQRSTRQRDASGASSSSSSSNKRSGEAEGSERKQKRLRVVLGKRKEEVKEESGKGRGDEEDEDDEDEDDDDERRPAANVPAALTKEQAEAMLAAAMAGDADGDAQSDIEMAGPSSSSQI